ncbi:spermidine synthase [Planosporangium thailandense]|uniref:Spermidine synthase n=2 Tax=Planosporangium thailandense TaxID=765197 RepID=A0ABX0XXJ6_9ACTN|nr:spermidine synthase [Planosporangium thailandense]
MLLVELALIRWTASNNINLASLTNFVLLASFLGIGVGFLRSGARHELFGWAPLALAALVVFVLAFPARLIAVGSPSLQGRFGWAPLPLKISLPVIFGLTVAVMAGIGQGVARVFARFEPLEAYRLDILGSICGIGVFSVLSFLRAPPVAWGLVAAVTFAVLLPRRPRWRFAVALCALGGVVVGLASESAAPNDRWSPYYKVTAEHPPNAPGALKVWANNIPHQTAYPIARLRRNQPFYFFPYRHVDRASLGDVLVIGAGTGNDVAVALSQGARHVDAVEIDPVLLDLGRVHHPNRPYADPRVTAHVADGRAFLHRSSRRYDLILFALPDSLTLLAGQSNLRLENYLLTDEALREARDHLKPAGTFAMYNYYQPFLLDRYAGTLRTVYGATPCAELGSTLAERRQAVLTVANTGPVRGCASPWHGRRLEPATDDHPFPYLATRQIPELYLRILGLVLIASVVVVRVAGGPLRGLARYTDLAFMGAAFMLLETKSIVQYALLFGSTWFVNSLVFAGVLVSVLAAVEVARRVRLPGPAVLYACLLGALAVAWLVPQYALLRLPALPRFGVATILAFTPIFLANLVFAQRFRDVGSSTTAFAANLLGAMVGGVLEYTAMITGYRFLLVVVAILYGLAFVTGRRHLTGRAPYPADPVSQVTGET